MDPLTPGPCSNDNAIMVFGEVALEARIGRAAVVGLVSLLIGGCVTAPPPAPPQPAPVVAPTSAPVCPVCEDSSAEIARLRFELASREAELRELRDRQRDQARVLQETAKQASRAKVKLRRLATQADAASYVAEVEVAIESARSMPVAPSRAPLLAIAQALLESSAAPFAQGDYGTAMDLAAQAEQLVQIVAGNTAASASGARSTAETPLDVTLRLRATIESNLRRQPGDTAASIAVLQEGTRLVATGYRSGWFRVETEDGRSGWMYQSVVGAP
jgi:hypothetical protein